MATKFKIYSATPVAPKDKEVFLDLRLRTDKDGGVQVVAYNEAGKKVANLVTFWRGTVRRHTYVPASAGFATNGSGQILLRGEDTSMSGAEGY